MKKAFTILIITAALLMGFMVIRAVTVTTKQLEVTPEKIFTDKGDTAAKRLSKVISLKTVSGQDPENFRTLTAFLETSFPQTHQSLIRNIFGNAGLLYKWKGSDESLEPVILMAHTDVVPIDPGTETAWTHPPFSGDIADGFIWGRGALDCKVSAMAILESVEWLLESGFSPTRTVYLAFGHDEEVGGPEGAAKIAEYLKQEQVKAQWILDEGGIIFSGQMAGVTKPVAMVGIAEKGYMTLELSVETNGGHSSMPPAETAIGILSKAIYTLEKNPFPARYEGVVADMFEYLAPEMPFSGKFFFSNSWLLKPVIKYQLEKVPAMNAALRTTIAPTIINAGLKENVLPAKSVAMVNFRLYPGDGIDDVMRHVTLAIDDPRVKITIGSLTPTTSSPITDINSESFEILQKTIHQAFSNLIVVPFLLNAGTDTKHYTDISKNIFRFLPARMKSEDFKRVHGTDERVEINNFKEMINFYAVLLKNTTGNR